MSISYDDFRSLLFQEQIVLVWEQGRYLATRYEEEDTIGLYHMTAGFFVEVFYDHVANHMQQHLRTFTDSEYLEDYAVYVKLDDLLNG